MFVTLEPHNHLLIKIPHYNDKQLIEVLSEYLTIHEKQFNEELSSSEWVPVKLLESDYYDLKDDQYIYVPINLVSSLNTYLFLKGYFVDDSQVKIDRTVNFKVDPYWYELFAGREDQTEFFDTVISSPRGIVQLPTGFGKSVFIISIAESLNEDGNILIVGPFNSIKEELSMRFKSRGIDVPTWFDINSRINIINAPGYSNSNNFNNPDCIDWMSKVKMVIIDECENIPDSMIRIFDQLKNYKYAYGMSASADKLDGNQLKVTGNGLFNLTDSTFKIISYVGFTAVYAKPKKKLELNIIKSKFGRKQLPFRNFNMEYRISIKNIYTHENFKYCLNYILNHKRDILFIPVTEINIGEEIYNLVSELGFDPVLWHAGGVMSNHGFNTYKDIKDYSLSNDFDVLIATKLAFLGIDITKISDILLFIGTQYNTIVQPIGRCFRHDHPACWLLEETGTYYYDDEDHPVNPIYRSCHYKRLGTIKRTYNYIENIISWTDVLTYKKAN